VRIIARITLRSDLLSQMLHVGGHSQRTVLKYAVAT
jgi:hypothetical protein